MQKQLLTFFGVLLSGVISAQVGINTTDPKSSLEIQGSLGIKVNTINQQGQTPIPASFYSLFLNLD